MRAQLRSARMGLFLLILLIASLAPSANGQVGGGYIPRFNLSQSGLQLERPVDPASFFDVVGRRSAVFGYENRGFEAWVYPLKLFDDFNLSFLIEGYPLEISSRDLATTINVRPEATTFTYSHAVFTVRQTIFAPIDEPGIVMLLDVQSVLPLSVAVWFRPRLRLMWPAGLMTGYVGWDAPGRVYYVTEETNRFVGIIGSPVAQDTSVMPYQEEPRDVPVRFLLKSPPDNLKSHLIPIVIAGGVEGREKAKASYDKLLTSVEALYQATVAHYRRLREETVQVTTPDEGFNKAFEWAKVGVDKGLATNPMLGTGLLAGFRTSGDSERPGFAWFFGRDAAWSALAITAYGDFSTTRTSLDFLKKFQREDGKIPHEVSQSAALIPWFTAYPYPWASADATPLYIIAHIDYWRASGDLDFIKKNWTSILKAYRFSAATDTDGNDLIENTNVGHGWVEGGALYPPHEEIYMQGLWVESLRGLAELADAVGDKALAEGTRASAERTRSAMEKTYWLADRGFYAFSTNRPNATPRSAEPGPNREIRQSRMNELAKSRLIDEDTVLPAVPLWWRTLDDERAQSQIDHLGSGALATDWGCRIISNTSRLYDPLSYHYGSIWPLFTGWSSMAAYQYGRPHVGYQALMSNALLTYQGSLGYVTELLSGDFNAPFGRSSHHQVWSEAMVLTPAIRGLLGIDIRDGGNALSFRPQLPANWDRVSVRNVSAGNAKFDMTFERISGRINTKIVQSRLDAGASQAGKLRLTISPAFPVDAKIRSVSVNNRPARFETKFTGDQQFAEVTIDGPTAVTDAVFVFDEGSEVHADFEKPMPGARNQGLRILRSRPSVDSLRLLIEGLPGRSYHLMVRTPRRLGNLQGVTIARQEGNVAHLQIKFEGSTDSYVRREIVIPFASPR